MADKVRYYLEQSVPELEDLQNKGLFERKEITMIMRRRTDFEQRIQGRTCQPRDFIRYTEFESNLEKLRLKRYRRLAEVNLVKTKTSVSDWAGVRRILFTFDRATRKFPSDLDLWLRYLALAKEHGAIKVVYKVYSKLLQLQPRNIDAWLSAAKYEFEENSNAKGARVLFQRGLKINPELLVLWLNYAQFELAYVSKLLARRQVLGLVTEKQQREELNREESERKSALEQDGDDDMDKDVIQLPDDEVSEQLNHLPEADMNVLGNPETNPVLRGDVALTVFDLCVVELLKHVPAHSTTTTDKSRTFDVVHGFLRVVDQFPNLNRDHLYVHVLNHIQLKYPRDIETLLIDITLPIRTVTVDDPQLAELLQLAVNKFLAYKQKTKNEELTRRFTQYLERFLDGANDRVASLLRAIIAKCLA